MDPAYEISCEIRDTNKVFRKACSSVILLNHKILQAKARYDRARATRRLAFRYSYRLRLTALEGVRNLIYEFACNKCDAIESLQAKLRSLTGLDYVSDSDAESDISDADTDPMDVDADSFGI